MSSDIIQMSDATKYYVFRIRSGCAVSYCKALTEKSKEAWSLDSQCPECIYLPEDTSVNLLFKERRAVIRQAGREGEWMLFRRGQNMNIGSEKNTCVCNAMSCLLSMWDKAALCPDLKHPVTPLGLSNLLHLPYHQIVTT